MGTLALQLVLAPLLVAAGSLAQRRWGQRVGGLVVGLPLTSLPLLFLVAVAHGPGFAARASTASLEGTVAAALMVWAWAAAARRRGVAASLAAGSAVFAASIAVLDLSPAWPAAAGACAGVLVYAATLRWWPQGGTPEPGSTRPGSPPPRRLWLRVLLAAGFSVVVAGTSGGLGPHLAGLVTALPLLTGVIGALTHREEGPTEARAFLHGVTRGSFSVVTALAVLAFGLPGGHVALCFAAAAAAAVATQAVTRMADREGATAAPGAASSACPSG
jgi:hypothetical protein